MNEKPWRGWGAGDQKQGNGGGELPMTGFMTTRSMRYAPVDHVSKDRPRSAGGRGAHRDVL